MSGLARQYDQWHQPASRAETKQIVCSRCGAEHNRKQRYCEACHAAYMREWRKTHKMNLGQRMRDNSRSYAGVFKRRGKIEQGPCILCGNPDSEMHHPDHEIPLNVVWLCRDCHLQWHAFWRNVSYETWLFFRKAASKLARGRSAA